MKKRAVVRIVLLSCMAGAGVLACATLPEPKVRKYVFPKNAYVGDVQRPYSVLGPVRSKVDYVSLDSVHEEKDLCKNYYNKAVRELLDYSRKQGGDAVVDVQTVVFLADGRRETYKTPECSDDGAEGQVLAQGIAVKWKSAGVGPGSWTVPRKHFVPQAAAAPAAKAPAVPVPPAMPLSPVILYEPPVAASDSSGSESVPMSATQPLETPVAPKVVPVAPVPMTVPALEPEEAPAAPFREFHQEEPESRSAAPMGSSLADPRMGPVFR